jgi:hypothetical protein
MLQIMKNTLRMLDIMTDTLHLLHVPTETSHLLHIMMETTSVREHAVNGVSLRQDVKVVVRLYVKESYRMKYVAPTYSSLGKDLPTSANLHCCRVKNTWRYVHHHYLQVVLFTTGYLHNLCNSNIVLSSLKNRNHSMVLVPD